MTGFDLAFYYLDSQTILVLIEKNMNDRIAYDYFRFFSSGGVVLASRDGKIVCENTLDARLDVAFRKKLPEVFLVQI